MDNKIRLVIGCNYHTKWQSDKSMRFVLAELKEGKARLKTRNTDKDFWTNIEDLIFIESDHNKKKAATIESNLSPTLKKKYDQLWDGIENK